MKGRMGILLVLPLMLLLILPASALSAEEVLTQQEEVAGVDELERAADQNGGIVDYGTTLDEGLGELLDTGTEEIGGILRRAVRSGVLLLIILMLCGMAETVQDTVGKNKVPVVSLA